jgi:ATP synthase protein I
MDGLIAMNKENRELFRSMASLSSIGLSAGLAIAIGVWFGLWLDAKLGTRPWFFYIFLLIGIAAGFKNIFVIAGREMRRNNNDKC